MSRYQLIWAIIVAWCIAALIGVSMLCYSVQTKGYAMCEPVDSKPTAPTDPLSKLLATMETAHAYVMMHTPQMRQRVRNAGLPDQLAFDPAAKELTALVESLKGVMSHVR
jgi:hypothetical protein